MDENRLKKLGSELEKARERCAEWAARVKVLEQKYREAENTRIHEIVHEAKLTPEQLAELISYAKAGNMDALPLVTGIPDTADSRKDEEEERDD